MATKRSGNPKALELVANTVIELHPGTEPTKAVAIAKVALNPPTWVSNDDHWLDVVVRGRHSNYGGATTHFRSSMKKHQIENTASGQ